MFYTTMKCPMEGGVAGYAMDTNHAHYTLPPAWIGSKVTFEADGANLFILFGTTAAVAASATAMSTVADTVITMAATTSAKIPANTAVEIQLPANALYFSVVSDGTGYWRAWRSDFGS